MHSHSIEKFRHEHLFLGEDHARNERKTWTVIALCGAMMVAEIGGGALFGSMALIADGLHMSTHSGALLIAALAYTYARRHAHDERFVFGTGKFGDLAAFTSAIILAMIAILIGWESIGRLLRPVPIAFDEAILVAVLGLCVNVASAWLLRDEHDHGAHAHEHDHDHDHHHDHADSPAARRPGHHRDLNLRAAYVHVFADAAVSVLAVIGLVAGRQFGWIWMDAVMGIVGACVIANWSWGLVRASGAILLDQQPDAALRDEILQRLERNGDRIADLHLWRVGPGHAAAVISVVSDHPEPPAAYRARLADFPGLSHVTIEVQPCPGH
ncbi:MAG TPA: CDF family Co(II)/Ni(II) efflux transporter DmeF [Candidatus Cybelea sp.]|nr:CDF family Co(II)/Ni(II) efflux transporter DmeF [Candidatus Cybelea sp.]